MCVCYLTTFEKIPGRCFEGITNLKLAVDNHHPFDFLSAYYELTMGLIFFLKFWKKKFTFTNKCLKHTTSPKPPILRAFRVSIGLRKSSPCLATVLMDSADFMTGLMEFPNWDTQSMMCFPFLSWPPTWKRPVNYLKFNLIRTYTIYGQYIYIDIYYFNCRVWPNLMSSFSFCASTKRSRLKGSNGFLEVRARCPPVTTCKDFFSKVSYLLQVYTIYTLPELT